MDLARNGDHTGELFQAQAHIWNHIFNFINSMSLKCAIQLGIPDIIHKHGQPMALAQLIDALPINNAKAPFVYRLMRILIHSGFFIKAKIPDNEGQEGYALTSASKLLLANDPFSVTPFLLAMLDPILTDPWRNFSQWFQNNEETPFHTCHGTSFWELAGRQPQLNLFFNEGMASDARLVSTMVIKNCKDVFMGLNSLIDVGGGTGTVAKAIADAFPHLKCSVLDLPHVVDGLESSKNLAYVGGDMFEAIPPADAVLLKGKLYFMSSGIFKWILHSWSDEECVQILRKCKEAIPSKEKGGKVIIIDMLLKSQQNGDDDAEAIETQLFFDMLMMVVVNGRERNEKDWEKLFCEAGFHGYKITPVLGLRSIIEVYYY
ncbi:trans-resveratrol di-O-methyltransferase-like isoform X1 [Coffea arabica]|uniref:7'-O-demethylcephaeline methyltransferase n=1 Tax=Coffea arabica TaxID=13443 RepID=A0A6P6SBV2_COFAR|nr:trans-resveratrol di-O-methyltransferase-like isoform X1 [Coffea arabica]